MCSGEGVCEKEICWCIKRMSNRFPGAACIDKFIFETHLRLITLYFAINLI